VSSLYTDVPIAPTRDRIQGILQNQRIHPLVAEEFLSLTRVSNVMYDFHGFQNGLPDSPISPLLADIFMGTVEDNIYFFRPSSNSIHTYWLSYVDDSAYRPTSLTIFFTFFLWKLAA